MRKLLLPWRHTPWSFNQDVLAGLIVSILIIPQAIGYGLLAHLPAASALACCIFPLLAYALFGNGRALAIGPVAIVSLMVGDALTDIPVAEQVAAAQLLALLVAATLLLMRLLKLGNLVHFIGHPVIHGFTAAAAVLIIMKQLPLLLGATLFSGQVPHIYTSMLGVFAILALIFIAKLPHPTMSKLGPLFAISFGVMTTYLWPDAQLARIPIEQGTSVIQFNWQLPWHHALTLLPSAALIALIGFLESSSVIKSLSHKPTAKTQAPFSPNQELTGLGAANIAAGLFQGFPVAGGFGRSMVNDKAGATSPMAGVFTAGFVLVFLLYARDIIQYIPIATLGAIVLMAVWPLLDFKLLFKGAHTLLGDKVIWLATFISVLIFGVEIGIAAGVLASLFLLIRHASQPHMAIVGRVPNSAHFRNELRHYVLTDPCLLAIRIDEGLHFANKEAINTFIEQALMEHPNTLHLLLVCSAVNVLDGDGIDLLKEWNSKLKSQCKVLHLAEVKGPIMDKLKDVHFTEQLEPGRVFLSTHEAFVALTPQ
jgi:SulP family sulfate permease